MDIKLSDINIRDPYIVPLPAEQRYLMFGTNGRNAWSGPGLGFDCFVSNDLENWSGPIPAFQPPADFWANTQFWAPECHFWRERYYLLASFARDKRGRGTQVMIADKPEGPYRVHSDGPVTPRGWECLDGTLFVDDDGAPWMVFCHEWVQVEDGEMCAVRLAADLSAAAGKPMLLFRASEAGWSKPFEANGRSNNRVTDGPFLYRTTGGRLIMLWSTVGVDGYTLGYASSETGRIQGPWRQAAEPLFSEDGGHGMIFRAFDGRLLLALHTPNTPLNERPAFLEIADRGDSLAVMRHRARGMRAKA